MQDRTDETKEDDKAEEPQAPEKVAAAEEAVPPVEETAPAEEAAADETAAASAEEETPAVAKAAAPGKEEALPESPPFGQRLQETLTSIREKLGATLAPLGARLGTALAPLTERLGETFAPVREKLGDSAWIYGVIGLVAVLLVVALFTPPFSLLQRLGITGYETLSADNPSITHPDGLTVSVPDTFKGKLRVRIDSVPRADFLAGYGADKAAVEALLNEYSYVQVKSPFYKIRVKGKTDQPLMLDVDMPAAAEPWETLDLYTWRDESWEWVGSELHTEDREHEFIRAQVIDIPANIVAAQTGSVPQIISTSVGPDDNLATGSGAVDEFNPTGLMLGPDGNIIGNLAQQPDTAAYVVIPTLRNWTPDGIISGGPLRDVMQNEANCQDKHITNIIEMCIGQGFAGVEIDYRGVTPEEQDAYSAFVAALADALHAEGLRLTVILEPPTKAGGVWDTGGYDWAAIGTAADAVKVIFPDDPAAYIEGGEAQQLLTWAVAQVSRYKLHMQVCSLSMEQRDDKVTHISMEEALAPIGRVETIGGATQAAPNNEIEFRLSGVESIRSIVPQDAAGTYRIEYLDEGDTTYTVWLGTAANLAVKLQWAQRYHLGGIAVTDLLNAGNAPDVVNAVVAYRTATTPATGQEIQVVWTVTSAAALIDRQSKPLNDPELGYTWLVMAATDTYTVKAEIGGYEHGSVPIVVAEVTPTPVSTPPPSPIADASGSCLKASFVSETVPDYSNFKQGETFVKSWTLQNSGSCDWPADTALIKVDSQTGGPDSVAVGMVAVGETKEIKVEMTAPGEDGSYTSKWSLRAGGIQIAEVWAVITVGEGGGMGAAASVATTPGAFELGGHVRDIGMPYASQMRHAGMTWAKVQVRYGQDASGIIRAAHDKNFKIQLSALGTPGMVTQAGFEQQFANWVAGMASAGADAIEVWNEPNLDREWQAGYIDPAAYTRLLCTCYSAIKTANPSTIVISAAVAPTGYYGGCGPNGCDDLPFLQGMYNAGASQCMDYLGAHHNSGATSPSARSGHPADDGRHHHSWYFLPQTEKYYAIFGKQLYYTEMGYASQEGLPTFSDGWAWARGTNNAQQAAWLAEAVQLSISNGMVRCIIVWNMDFTRYGDDPQDGYAIIRPDGSCPACDSLHNVMGSR